MSLKNWTPGIGYVPTYQLSGVPFVTSSLGTELDGTRTPVVRFPFVTRWVEIVNTGDSRLKVGFTANGVAGTGGSVSGSNQERKSDHSNFFILGTSGSASGGTVRWELRCKELHFGLHDGPSTGFTVVAGLTGIPSNEFPTLTGSQGFIGVG